MRKQEIEGERSTKDEVHIAKLEVKRNFKRTPSGRVSVEEGVRKIEGESMRE